MTLESERHFLIAGLQARTLLTIFIVPAAYLALEEARGGNRVRSDAAPALATVPP